MTDWNDPQAGYAQSGNPGPGGYGPPSNYGYDPQRPGGQPGLLQQSQTYGIVGTVLALLGGILVLVSFTAIDWFSYSDSGFSDLHHRLQASSNPPDFPAVYFSWLGWVFLVIAVVAGVLASVPTPALRISRIIGSVVGFAAAGLTFLAIELPGSYSEYIKHARVGFYFAVIGFLITGIGAAIGPRKV
jgi:hypothetical membrane protein